MMDLARIEELEAMEKEAAHGDVVVRRSGDTFTLYAAGNRALLADVYHSDDAKLYAAARNALPALLAAARENVRLSGLISTAIAAHDKASRERKHGSCDCSWCVVAKEALAPAAPKAGG